MITVLPLLVRIYGQYGEEVCTGDNNNPKTR
jgi:hypothetical protein